MTDGQSSNLWAFARGDRDPLEFEAWFLAEEGMNVPLGEPLNWDLTSSDYRRSDEVKRLQKTLFSRLKAMEKCPCECISLSDIAVVPMAGDGLPDKVFGTLTRLRWQGEKQWWLSLSKCGVCEQHWMIAQDEQIYDDFFLRRLTSEQVSQILSDADWPTEFDAYEKVLRVARTLSTPPTWFDLNDSPVAFTIHEMQATNPALSLEDAAYIIGVGLEQVQQLMNAEG